MITAEFNYSHSNSFTFAAHSDLPYHNTKKLLSGQIQFSVSLKKIELLHPKYPIGMYPADSEPGRLKNSFLSPPEGGLDLVTNRKGAI